PLLPKPLSLLNLLNYSDNLSIIDKLEIKKIKKSKFISINLFKNIIKNNSQNYLNYLINNSTVFNDILIEKDEKSDLRLLKKFQNIDIILTKNSINRLNNYSENLYFEEATLKLIDDYFLVYFYDKNFINEFEYIINIGSKLGLGGNKNIGWGKISINFDELLTKKFSELNIVNINVDTNNIKFLTLSPIILKKEAIEYIDFENSFYEFETYKSYSESSYKQGFLKKKVIYINEGSVISIKKDFIIKNKFIGYLKEVGNNIKQYGLEFPIQID
ncbi:MAG: type III-A CRISPR-associated RAMP protein Csm4, partial [bacterium]